jgi:hypothetical protein
MRLGLTLAMVGMGWMAMACVASSTPDANGYNVQLYFDGAPLGSAMAVGEPGVVTVKRMQTQAGRCAQASASCDPTTLTPIVLVSASCEKDLCVVTPQTSEEPGVVALQATGVAAGTTTLRVRVRSTIDGSEWDDGYPLAFRAAAPPMTQAPAPIRAPRAAD